MLFTALDYSPGGLLPAAPTSCQIYSNKCCENLVGYIDALWMSLKAQHIRTLCIRTNTDSVRWSYTVGSS